MGIVLALDQGWEQERAHWMRAEEDELLQENGSPDYSCKLYCASDSVPL